MSLIVNLKKNKVLIGIFLLLAVIIISSITIYFIDKKNNNAPSATEYKSSFNNLRGKLIEIGQKNSLSKNATFQRTMSALDKLTSQNLSQQQKYETFQFIFQYYYALYQDTNNHDLYINGNIFDDFAKQNFPTLYNNKDFVIRCQDPQCATAQQPAEIDNILKEIEASDFPDPVKKSVLQDIKNDGYFQSADDRARNYILSINIIRSYNPFSPSGTNKKIASDLEDFVKNRYPGEYIRYKGFLQTARE